MRFQSVTINVAGQMTGGVNERMKQLNDQSDRRGCHIGKHMKLTHTILLTAFIGGLLLGRPVRGDDTADTIQELKRQIQELDQKVRVLEREKEVDTEATDAKAGPRRGDDREDGVSGEGAAEKEESREP